MVPIRMISADRDNSRWKSPWARRGRIALVGTASGANLPIPQVSRRYRRMSADWNSPVFVFPSIWHSSCAPRFSSPT